MIKRDVNGFSAAEPYPGSADCTLQFLHYMIS